MPTLRRSLLAASSLALLMTAGALPAAAASPAGIAPSPSGWVVVRKPTLASYTPRARDRGNSSGGTVTVTRAAKGQWTVAWDGLDAAGGNLQVSAIGSSLRHCMAYEWDTNYGVVYCYTRNNSVADEYGRPADVPFVATIVGEAAPVTGNPGRLGYAWMNLATSSGTPSASYNYASPGGQISVVHTGTGTYTLTVPGVGKDDGVVQLTGYIGNLDRCQVNSWGMAGLDLHATVSCVNLKGVLKDNEFSFLYMRRIGLEGYSGGPAASLWANRPTSASYHPDPFYAWSSAGKRPTIRRTAKGVYSVTLLGMPSGGAAIVTAYGPTTKPRACQIGSIRTSGTPQVVQVRCFTYAGAAADSQFVLSYTH